MKKAICIVAALSVLAANAAVVRKLPVVSVVENETISTDSLKATAVRSSNASVFGASLRESGEAMISGARIGEAVMSYVDSRGVFATRPVMVVPAYWEVLKGLFSEDPEVTISIVGDKVVVGGSTANVDTLRRVEEVKNLDKSRIVTQVTYSTAQIGELVRDFLRRSNVTNIGVNVVGREVCLSGRMYDTQSIEQLKKRVEGFVKDFPGITVNTDELRIYKQKILINIEFVAYNDTMSRNLGFEGPEKATAKLSTGTIQYKRDTKHGNGEAHTWSRDFNFSVDAQAQINLLKKNGAAKKLYATTLSTQSGIEAEFQNGGTIHHNMLGGMGANGSMESIEYGYIIKALPQIVDANTVNLELSLDNKQRPANWAAAGNNDIEIFRYLTKSKYLVRPGETIILSGYKYNSESEDKKGTPWLSKIPWIGPYLFGNTADELDMNEVMLVVTVNWAVEGDGDNAAAKLREMKDRKVEVEMP